LAFLENKLLKKIEKMKKKIFIPNSTKEVFTLLYLRVNFFLGLQKLRFPTVRPTKSHYFFTLTCPDLPCPARRRQKVKKKKRSFVTVISKEGN